MPIRNPFARRTGVGVGVGSGDENVRPGTADTARAPPAFERVDTVGSKASISSRRSQDTGEYKMSVVNDSGVYLPPSPTEKDGPWNHRRFLSRTSTETRSSNDGNIEPFSISRESFDSYRRSFDISAKSPIIIYDSAPRQSLDSARFRSLPRSAVGDRKRDGQPATAEEGFEDVGLNDDQLQQQRQAQGQHPRRRGLFSRFSEAQQQQQQDGSSGAPASQAPVQTQTSGSSMSRFLPGRKRGQSGQGAELGYMDRSVTPVQGEVQEVSAA